jgi:hypothetical protein
MVTEKTDFEVRAIAIQTTAKVSASYDLLIIDKKEFDL